MDARLIVFSKPPRPGASKTRLAADLGDERAALLAAAFLADTLSGLAPLGVPIVVATTDPAADHGVPCLRWDQGDGDLGARIERMLARALAESPVAVALGADSPGMPLDRLRGLLAAPGDAAIGPAEDGGFWGLRVARVVPGMLAGIRWSAPSTGEETVRALEQAGFTVGRADPWRDIDTLADLDQFRREVPWCRAPVTHDLLRGILDG